MLPGQLWATGVTAWTIVLPGGDARQATHLGYQLTLAEGGQSMTSAGGAAPGGR